MSTTPTIPAGTKIYPYATSEGIIQLVPLEALEQVIQERDNAAVRVAVLEERNVDLENQRDQARQQADAELVKRRNFFLAAQNADAEADQLRAEVEELRSQRDQLNDAVGELNQRLIERTRDMLAKQSELVQEARQARREARKLAEIIEWWEALRRDSAGVAGYHQNGDVAAWDEFEIPSMEANPVRPNAADSADNLRTGIEIGPNVVALLKMPVPVKELAAIIDHVQVAYGPGLRIAEKPKGWLQFFKPTTPEA